MARSRAHRAASGAPNPAEAARSAGVAAACAHPLLTPLARRARIVVDRDGDHCPAQGWATVAANGTVWLNGTRRGRPEEWEWVLAHCLLHLAFGHLDDSHLAGWHPAAGTNAKGSSFPASFNAAACLVVRSFQAGVRIGSAPAALAGATPYDDRARGHGAEMALSEEFARLGVPAGAANVGVGGPGGDLATGAGYRPPPTATWAAAFSEGLQGALAQAVAVAGGSAESMTSTRPGRTRWRDALDWVVTAMPLLGGLAAGMRIVEDVEVCRAEDVDVAAVAPAAGALYFNPRFGGTADERRFVAAHELLHAGLRHDTRAGGRDLWYWNVATDYVINGWLVEMGVGTLPESCLHDPALAGLSAEDVYDRIVSDLRRYRKLATLRGAGRPDILTGPLPGTARPGEGVDLDEFYRRALSDGAAAYLRSGRGLLPAGLAEAIAAAAEPPPPWDVDLARWFEERFAPLERRRSYARASRRQSATPDIPRPSWVIPEEVRAARTFGVVLDTSGSMGARLLAKALGAVASYATARDVPRVRVVFCDAVAYDAGWMDPADIAGTVTVRGRGGTVLQPGVDLLQSDPTFPAVGPILVITDTGCDHVRLRREHAWLIPAGTNLPFRPHGPVFRMT